MKWRKYNFFLLYTHVEHKHQHGKRTAATLHSPSLSLSTFYALAIANIILVLNYSVLVGSFVLHRLVGLYGCILCVVLG